MRRILIAAIVGIIAVTAIAQAQTRPQSGQDPVPEHCTAASHRTFSKAVWRLGAWERAKPPAKAVQAHQRRLACAPPPHRAAMKRQWRSDQVAFYRHRSDRLFIQRVTPFYCGASEITFDPGWYAIPCYNVDAESGGRGGIYCNTYGVIGGLDEPNASNPTWIEYGGLEFAPTACAATEREQSIVAHRLYKAKEGRAWDPFE